MGSEVYAKVSGGLLAFKGEITHTAKYKGAEPFRGKRVVCVGMGETSANITSQICEVASACHLALRMRSRRSTRSSSSSSQRTRSSLNPLTALRPRGRCRCEWIVVRQGVS
jgi:cation diffusion facilitator CzcD-associated flavoprotein CzcO